MIRTARLLAAALLWLLARDLPAQQKWEFGGFVESAGQLYARKPNPSDAFAIGAVRAQIRSRVRFSNTLSWRGAYDIRLDTHRDVDRTNRFDVSQRGLRQPAGTLTECYLEFKAGPVDLRAGNQQIRWGRADGFNPTDNLVPYDYLDTFADQRLPVTALQADMYVAKARFEVAWIPFFTPTRLPLLGQRWFPGSSRTFGTANDAGSVFLDGTRTLPARTFGNGQWAVRWNQIVPRGEFSVSYFDGFDDLPFFSLGGMRVAEPREAGTVVHVPLNRQYCRVRVAGADFASELGPFGIRGETAYFDSTDPANRDHLLYVIGMDHTRGDWFAIVQYADLWVSSPVPETALFPELALRSTLMARIEKKMGPENTFEIKGAVRLRDGDAMVQPLCSIGLSGNWRLKIGATFFSGPRASYFGQFRDNANFTLALRYSF